MRKLLVFLIWMPIGLYSQGIQEEEILLKNGEIVLPGTLSFPKTHQKVPLVLFIHGSGNGDRNGNQAPMLNTNHIKSLADSLNNRGIAFYRYDKRTATKENLAKMKDPSLYDLAEDAKVAIHHFDDDERFNGIHIIGHSQGSLVGMLAVGNEIRSYVSLAGPGTTIDKTLIRQITEQNEDLGKVAAQHVQELMETDTILEVHPFLVSIFASQNQSYLKEWIRLDPVMEIKKLALPVLIVNGDADIQVKEEDAELLKQAMPNAQIAIIPNMSHTLKTVNDFQENQRSYTDPSFPLSRELVETLYEFIQRNE